MSFCVIAAQPYCLCPASLPAGTCQLLFNYIRDLVVTKEAREEVVEKEARESWVVGSRVGRSEFSTPWGFTIIHPKSEEQSPLFTCDRQPGNVQSHVNSNINACLDGCLA